MRRSAPTTSIAAAAVLLAPSLAFAAADFKIFPDPGHMAVNMVIFAALIWPVNKLLIQPLLRVIETREERTVGALQQAAQYGDEATSARTDLEGQLRAARTAAAEVRAGVLAEAESQEQALIGAARETAAATVKEVRDSVAQELGSARDALRAQAGELAQVAASRILGRSL